ncbi:MAG TPA: GNAT family protein [Mycobacteriales bacterium]|nr:GNAT family protein [Mycobacteriales bacterium]
MNLDALRDQATLTDGFVRLEQLDEPHLAEFWSETPDPEIDRLTATRETFTEDQIRHWLRTRPGQPDRADWAIVRVSDSQVVGEVVLNDLSEENEKLGFRIALSRAEFLGQGYGTAATRLAVDYAFDMVGVHRLELNVYAFNPRAQRVYEKCGFRREGVLRDDLLWDGQRYDTIVMAIIASDRAA